MSSSGIVVGIFSFHPEKLYQSLVGFVTVGIVAQYLLVISATSLPQFSLKLIV
jgi:hypothetical protein